MFLEKFQLIVVTVTKKTKNQNLDTSDDPLILKIKVFHQRY